MHKIYCSRWNKKKEKIRCWKFARSNFTDSKDMTGEVLEFLKFDGKDCSILQVGKAECFLKTSETLGNELYRKKALILHI